MHRQNNASKDKILLVGLAMEGAGFTNLISKLGSCLTSKYEVHFFGICEHKKQQPEIDGLTTHFCHFGMQHPVTSMVFSSLLEKLLPEIVFIVGQPWWMESLLKTAEPFRGKTTVFLYSPFEGDVSSSAPLSALKHVDHLILYSRFSLESLKAAANGFPLPKMHILPHGVDLSDFKPLLPIKDGSDLQRNQLADRKSTRLNSSHRCISYAVFCLKKKIKLTSNFQIPFL